VAGIAASNNAPTRRFEWIELNTRNLDGVTGTSGPLAHSSLGAVAQQALGERMSARFVGLARSRALG
jgi:hypothetical protein